MDERDGRCRRNEEVGGKLGNFVSEEQDDWLSIRGTKLNPLSIAETVDDGLCKEGKVWESFSSFTAAGAFIGEARDEFWGYIPIEGWPSWEIEDGAVIPESWLQLGALVFYGNSNKENKKTGGEGRNVASPSSKSKSTKTQEKLVEDART